MKAYAAEGDSAPATTSTEATTTQPAVEGEQKEASFFDSPLMLVALGAVWLWVLYSMRKNKKKQKKAKEKLNELKKGDKIITIGRVHGVITKLTEETFSIKPDKKSDFTLTFDRSAIMSVNPEKSEKSEEIEEKAEGVAEQITQK